MRTLIEKYLHIIKNCIRPPYKKLNTLKSGFIENSNFENNRDPWGHFTSSNTNLDQFSSSESRSRIYFKSQPNISITTIKLKIKLIYATNCC